MMINKIVGVVSFALLGSVAHAKILDTQETAPQAVTQQETVAQTAAITPAQKVRGFYLGMGVGNTRFDSDDLDVSNDDMKDYIDGNTIKILAGYQFNRVFALETQHTQYGELFSFSSPTSWSFSANLGYTFSNGLRPFGVLGLANVDLDMSDYEWDTKGVGVHYGVGLEYAPAQLKGFSVRLGYEADLSAIEEEFYVQGNGFTIYHNETYDYTLGSFYAAASYKF